jgi:hypothetical protein
MAYTQEIFGRARDWVAFNTASNATTALFPPIPGRRWIILSVSMQLAASTTLATANVHNSTTTAAVALRVVQPAGAAVAVDRQFEGVLPMEPDEGISVTTATITAGQMNVTIEAMSVDNNAPVSQIKTTMGAPQAALPYS